MEWSDIRMWIKSEDEAAVEGEVERVSRFEEPLSENEMVTCMNNKMMKREARIWGRKLRRRQWLNRP
jgi:hypothetical protein